MEERPVSAFQGVDWEEVSFVYGERYRRGDGTGLT